MVMAEKTPTFVTSPRIFALKRDQTDVKFEQHRTRTLVQLIAKAQVHWVHVWKNNDKRFKTISYMQTVYQKVRHKIN